MKITQATLNAVSFARSLLILNSLRLFVLTCQRGSPANNANYVGICLYVQAGCMAGQSLTFRPKYAMIMIPVVEAFELLNAGDI